MTPQNTVVFGNKNLSVPISEPELLSDCNRRNYEIRARLAPYKRAVGRGWIRRVVIGGTAWYLPTGAA